MTDIKVFFNKPVRPAGIADAMIADIRAAKARLLIASAWFTETRIAQAFIDSPIAFKSVVLNRADLNRPGSHKAIEMLMAHDPGMIFTLGSADFTEGVMHHKFIISDDVVWTGSFNLTYQASKNYENAIRIADKAITDLFYEEYGSLVADMRLWWGTTQVAQSDAGDAFRCCYCEKLKPFAELGENDGSNLACKPCHERETAEWQAREAQRKAARAKQ